MNRMDLGYLLMLAPHEVAIRRNALNEEQNAALTQIVNLHAAVAYLFEMAPNQIEYVLRCDVLYSIVQWNSYLYIQSIKDL